MKVTFDGAIFSMQRIGGISRYFASLLENMPSDIQATLLTTGDSNSFSSANVKSVSCGLGRCPKALQAIQRLVERPIVKYRDWTAGGDLIHWSYYVGLRRRPITRSSGRLNVVTVYDMIHELIPETDPRGREVKWKREAIAQADLILCISETTRQDLIRLYPETESRTKTILLGNPLEGVVASELPHSLQGVPFILFVGGRGGYKNFGLLARAWQQARQRCPEMKLVVVGSEMKSEELDRWGLTQELDGVIQLGQVGDQQLACMYQHCKAFVFPSRYEGFGLPEVEAMYCGALLLSSGCGSLAEIAGDGAIFFDPDDIHGLSQLLIEAISDSRRCQETRQRGLRRAKDFSWAKTARETYAAYRELVA